MKTLTPIIGSDIQLAADLLRQGKLIAMPTETVYGLAADAKNPSAVARVFKAKGRPVTNPLIIHLSSGIAITDWAIHVPPEAFILAECFWPGPLTLILERAPEVPKIVTANQETVGLRVPNHPMALELLREFGGGVAAPSANRFGRISPTEAQHVEEELQQSIDYILEGGPCALGIESTIVHLAKKHDGKYTPMIMRQGIIKRSDIEKVLGREVLEFGSEGPKESTNLPAISIKTPGLDASHYAPEKPLYLLQATELLSRLKTLLSDNKKVGILYFNDKAKFEESDAVIAKAHAELTDFFKSTHFSKQNKNFNLEIEMDPVIYARNLYAHLRKLDKLPIECILVEKPPMTEAWLAIQDRLLRAAYKKNY